MLAKTILALAALLISAAVSQADVTKYNFAATFVNADPSRRITEHCVDGSTYDAHSGNIMQDGDDGPFYHYGEHHGGGFRWKTALSAPSGFNVYRSTDLVNCVRRGYVLDPADQWTIDHGQPITSGPSAGGGIFRPHMEKDLTNGNYGLFFNGFNAAVNTTSNIYYAPCTLPDSAASCATPVGVTIPTGPAGDHNVFINRADNKMYLVWSVLSSRDINICELATARTSCNGSAVLVRAAGGEGVWGVIRDSTGKVYVGFGGLCAYCAGGATTSYAMASAPLSTYSAPTQIDTSSTCNTQTMEVNKIVSGGQTTYLFVGEGWTGNENQSWADPFYAVLSFTGDAIDTMPCSTSVTVPGVTSAGTYPVPNDFPGGTVDQSTVANRGVFNDRCYINATVWEYQTFTPTSANLYAVWLPLAKNQPFGYATDPEDVTDGSLVVSIKAVDGSRRPTGAAIGSVTIPASSLLWGPLGQLVVFNITTLTPAVEYAIVENGSGTTTGCFTTTISQYSNVYPSGIHANSTNSGSTWTTNTNFAMMFATYSAAPVVAAVPFSGVAH